MGKEVTLYSKTGCGQCLFTKKYLDRSNISYLEKNITDNPLWGEEVKALGFSSLPVVVIEGETPFTGYQPHKLAEMIN